MRAAGQPRSASHIHPGSADGEQVPESPARLRSIRRATGIGTTRRTSGRAWGRLGMGAPLPRRRPGKPLRRRAGLSTGPSTCPRSICADCLGPRPFEVGGAVVGHDVPELRRTARPTSRRSLQERIVNASDTVIVVCICRFPLQVMPDQLIPRCVHRNSTVCSFKLPKYRGDSLAMRAQQATLIC